MGLLDRLRLRRPSAGTEVLRPGESGYAPRSLDEHVMDESTQEVAFIGEDGRPVGSVRVTTSVVVGTAAARQWAAMTPQEQREQRARDSEALRLERLAAGGSEAARERRGHVRGKHYTEWPDTVRDLKRDQRYDEALALLGDCIAAAERDRDGREPAPWYTENAAIIHRKRGDLAAEIAVLERYVRACPARVGRTGIHERLDKARALATRCGLSKGR